MVARARRKHEPALRQIEEHARHLALVVAQEALHDAPPRHELLAADEVEHRLPERRARLGFAFTEPPQLAHVGAQSHPEHVCAHLAAHALRLELARELHEHLVGDVRDGRADAARRRELRDQHRHLPHRRIDQDRDVHRQL